MTLHVYGPGCANCARLARHTREALERLGQTMPVVKVTDLNAITEAGVMRTPALGTGEVLLFQGRVPDVAELTTILADALRQETPTDSSGPCP